MRLCIDTNAYTALMNGEKRIHNLLENAEEVHIPVTVLGELYSGFQQGKFHDRNIIQLDKFLSKPGIFIENINKDVAFRYGFLVSELRKKGTPIPSNDLWIAAVSLNSGAILVSRDKHFKDIPGLQVLDF